MAREGTFALQLGAFAKKAGLNADKVVRKISIDMLGRIILRSPVDTGRFRGNWQMTFNAPASGNLATVDANGAATIAKGAAVLAGYVQGQTVWLTNNLPYSIELEYGHSKQAPAGIVRLAVREFQGIANAAASSVQR